MVERLVGARKRVAAYNRSPGRIDDVVRDLAAGYVVPATSVADAVRMLAPPRLVLLAVPADGAPDDVIAELVRHLEPGDVIVDAGNSHFGDSSRRARELRERGVHFLDAGISGFGTRYGPAITVGGSSEGWQLGAGVLRAVAGGGKCDRVGESGAGHFAKLVHNAIEYADMQLICEAYHLLRDGAGLSVADARRVFEDWSGSELAAYLVEITANILAAEDADGSPLVERILDVADQRGTGGWAVEESVDLGVPATLVAEAVHARSLSARKDERLIAAHVLSGPSGGGVRDGVAFVDDLHSALLASRAVSYTQAFMLLQRGAESYGWTLDRAAIAGIWQDGSIVGSTLLEHVRDALTDEPELSSLLLDDRFGALIDESQAGWRRVVTTAVELGLPVPAHSAALAFYDTHRAARLPANLLQAQRDYFAAHTYERVDRERGLRFHTDWPGAGTRGD
jgi:6-phosphogluconate dehydrogenase